MKLIDCMTEIQYMGIPINNVQATKDFCCLIKL